MYEGDPIGFMDASFPDVETSEGLAGQDLLDPQWALAEVTDPEYRESKEKKTPGINFKLVLDEALSAQPKRSQFFTWWLTPGMQPQIDGFFKACGLGVLSHKLGIRYKDDEYGNPKEVPDPRPIAPDIPAAGKAWAAALKGRKLIVCIGIESAEGYEDKNKLTGMHRVTDGNLAALAESGFGPKSITVKKDQQKQSYLVAKKGGKGAATPAAGASRVIA